jgi:hypothetical protein
MKIILMFFLSVSVFITSCNEILFHEELTTRTIVTGDFHALRVYGIYDIVLIQDSTNRIDISGVNNVSSVDAVVINDTLIVDNHKRITFNPHKNKLSVHFTDLRYLVTNDPVNVTNYDTIRAGQLIFEAYGEIVEARMVLNCDNLYFVSYPYSLGFFHFSGKSNSCLLWNNYGSTIFADSLSCKYAEIITSSVGDVFVNASENIRISLDGPGNVYYHGNPAIEIAEKKGTGKIIPLH